MTVGAMVASSVEQHLADTGGFTVESPDGEVGSVEEIWWDERHEPRVLAIRTVDGSLGVVGVADVVSIDPDHDWVVVRTSPTLVKPTPARIATAAGTKSDALALVELFAGILLIAATMMTLAFGITWLVTGTPY
jgi:hypothetical protein